MVVGALQKFPKLAWGVLVMLGLLTLGPALIPAEHIRTFVIDKVYAAIGRNLVIDGPITLRILPYPEIAFERVLLSGPAPDSPPLFSAYRVAAIPSLSGLLRGDLALAELSLSLADVHLRVDVQGRRNWRFSKPASPILPPDQTSTPAAEPAPPVVPQMTSAPSTLASPTVSSPAPGLSPAPVTSLPNPQPTAGSVAAGTLVSRSVSGMKPPKKLPIERIRISNARVTYSDDTRGHSVALDGLMANIALEGSDHLSVDLSALLDDRRWRLQADLASIAGLMTEAGSTVTGFLTGSQTTVRLDGFGALGGGVPRGTLLVEGTIDPRHYGQILAGRLSRFALAMGERGSKIALKASLNGDRLTVDDVVLELGEVVGTLQAKVIADLGGTPLAVRADIRYDQINLNRLFSAPEATGVEPTTIERLVVGPARFRQVRGSSAWRDKHFPLSRLAGLNADITIKGESLRFRNTVIESADAALTVKQGRVDARAQAIVGSGSASLSAELDTSNPILPSANMGLTLHDITLDDFMAGGRSVVKSGRISGAITLHGAGDSLINLLSSIRGRADIQVEQAGFRLYRLGKDWLNSLIREQESCPAIIEPARLEAKIDAAEGIISIESASVRADDFKLSAAGTVNLPARQLDIWVGNGQTKCLARLHARGDWQALTFSP